MMLDFNHLSAVSEVASAVVAGAFTPVLVPVAAVGAITGCGEEPRYGCGDYCVAELKDCDNDCAARYPYDPRKPDNYQRYEECSDRCLSWYNPCCHDYQENGAAPGVNNQYGGVKTMSTSVVEAKPSPQAVPAAKGAN